MSALALAAPPALATLGVAVALIGLRAAPTPVGARVYGAPAAEGRLALRALVLRGVDGREGPAPHLPVTARLGAQRVDAVTDADGAAVLVLAAESGELTLHAEGLEPPLAVGSPVADPERWRAGEQRGMAPLLGRVAGPLLVEAALERGVAVVSRPAPLLLRVSRQGAAVGGVTLLVDADAATVEPARAATDAHGLARFTWSTVDPGGGLRVAARLGDETGAWEGVVPAASGCEVEFTPDGWQIRAPVPRERVAWALQHPGGVSARGLLALAPRGPLWEGTLPPLAAGAPGEPRWLVVGPDPALDGATSVGWPLPAPTVFPPEAWRRVPDLLLLDGLPAAAAIAARRARQVRAVALAFTALMAALSLGQLVRDRARMITPPEVGAARDERWPLPLALVLIASGYALLGAALWAASA